MRRLRYILFLVVAMLGLDQGVAATLSLQFCPRFNGAPLVFDAFTNRIASGQIIAINRLDFLISDVSLCTANGNWIYLSNQFGFISLRDGGTHLTLDHLPTGTFDRLRYKIGLPPQINHGDVSQWPARHPLNPEVNRLHWGWSGGYVFLALEGHWLSGDGSLRGFSYHLANDPQLMTVETPIQLSLNRSNPTSLKIVFAIDQLFPQAFTLSEINSTTHSRTNDSFARQFAYRVERSFHAESESSAAPVVVSNLNSSLPLMASNAAPYPFTMSSFFPQPQLPRDNPLTQPGVALGRKLFFDKNLSGDLSQSCASCHQPAHAYADPRALSSPAAHPSATHRHAMSLLNLAWKTEFFWDGRAPSLRAQVLQPIQNRDEMAANLDAVISRLQTNTTYPSLFANAFGSPEISPDRLARALEQFVFSLTSFDSKFDRVINGRDTFTAAEQRGFELFNTEYDPAHGQFGADCFHCHGGPLFQSQSFANNGLNSTFEADAGRSLVTGRAGDAGKFAVPSLRNVELRAPYMHDGSLKTLEAAVAHYVTGVKRSSTLDPNLAKHPAGGVPLSATDQAALVAFLKTLTDPALATPDANFTSASALR